MASRSFKGFGRVYVSIVVGLADDVYLVKRLLACRFGQMAYVLSIAEVVMDKFKESVVRKRKTERKIKYSTRIENLHLTLPNPDGYIYTSVD